MNTFDLIKSIDKESFHDSVSCIDKFNMKRKSTGLTSYTRGSVIYGKQGKETVNGYKHTIKELFMEYEVGETTYYALAVNHITGSLFLIEIKNS